MDTRRGRYLVLARRAREFWFHLRASGQRRWRIGRGGGLQPCRGLGALANGGSADRGVGGRVFDEQRTGIAGTIGRERAQLVDDSIPCSTRMGERLALQMGYTHLHQSYSSIAAIAQAPERNYVWMSIAYQFLRPLGR